MFHTLVAVVHCCIRVVHTLVSYSCRIHCFGNQCCRPLFHTHCWAMGWVGVRQDDEEGDDSQDDESSEADSGEGQQDSQA